MKDVSRHSSFVCSVLAVRRLTLLSFGGLLAALSLLGACSSEPTIQTGEDAETIMEGRLARVDNSRSDLTYLDPTADYARYRRVYLAPLDVDNVEITQPPTSSSVVNRLNREWELDDEDKARLQAAFHESMSKAITRGGAYELADAGGDDVISIEAMVTQIAPAAPRDDARSRNVPRSRVYTQGAGSISIAIVLADGDSGEILALIKDTRNSDNASWGVNNRVTNMAEVRRAFSAWGTRIHDGLLTLKARAEAQGEDP